MWTFCPDVCIGTMCMLGACRGRRGNHSPWTGVTERDNWRTGAENRAWVFWRATRALNHRGNFLAPEHPFFFFLKWSTLDSYLSLTEIKSGTWRQAWFHHLYNQPGAPCIRTHEGNCLQAGSSSASTQSIFRSICPGMVPPTELGHLTSVNYPGSSSQASLV